MRMALNAVRTGLSTSMHVAQMVCQEPSVGMGWAVISDERGAAARKNWLVRGAASEQLLSDNQCQQGVAIIATLV